MKLMNSFFWKFNMVLLGTGWNYVWIRWSSSEMVIRVLKWRQFSITGFFSEWNKGSSGPNSGKFKGNFFTLHVQVLNFFCWRLNIYLQNSRIFLVFADFWSAVLRNDSNRPHTKIWLRSCSFSICFFLWRKREIGHKQPLCRLIIEVVYLETNNSKSAEFCMAVTTNFQSGTY